MSYLVTGATGLVGSRVVRDLVNIGEPVVGYEQSPNMSILKMLMSEDEIAEVKIVQGDILELDRLMRIARENNIDTIIHLAATLGAETKDNLRQAVRVNVEGTINVFETARLLGMNKVVWASSSTVFTAGKYEKEYIPNDAPHYPWDLYGSCKAFGENVADYYFQEFGMDITALRYGTIFGVGQQRGNSATIVRELILNPALGKPGRLTGRDDVLAWTYVDDAARVALLACKYRRGNIGAFNIMGQLHSVKELAAYVRELIPDADIELLPGHYAGPRWKLESAVTEKEVGYHPQWLVKEGIRETINIVRRQHGLPPV
ncbi:NAD-dependent epimerase/dehydratase family protein [Chloroflexota bacterium]